MATDLSEALTATGASALVEKVISPVLLEYVRRYSPLVRTIPTEPFDSTVYYFNQRTALPSGGPVTDGGARPVSTSTFVQNSFPVKLFQVVGAVTGFAQAVTRDLIGNLRATEIEGAVRNMSWNIETDIVWGNAASTVAGPYPHFDGLDTQVSTFSGTSQNAIDASGASLSLGYLDQVIDLVESNAAMPVETTSWFFLMSPTANSRVAQLLQQYQRFMNEVEVASGLVVPTYRNVPIIKSSFLSARGLQQNAVTATASGSGGTLPAAATYYKLTPVMSTYGELVASAEATATPTSGENIVLTWTPNTGPDGATPMLYKVFRSSATGTETLLGYVDGYITDPTTGNVYPVNQITDNGTTLVPQYTSGSTITPTGYPAAYVGTNTDIKPLSAGGENIYLLPRNKDFMVRPEVRPLGTVVDIYPTTSSPDSLPFAMVTDTTLAIRAPKYVGRLADVNATLSS